MTNKPPICAECNIPLTNSVCTVCDAPPAPCPDRLKKLAEKMSLSACKPGYDGGCQGMSEDEALGWLEEALTPMRAERDAAAAECEWLRKPLADQLADKDRVIGLQERENDRLRAEVVELKAAIPARDQELRALRARVAKEQQFFDMEAQERRGWQDRATTASAELAAFRQQVATALSGLAAEFDQPDWPALSKEFVLAKLAAATAQLVGDGQAKEKNEN